MKPESKGITLLETVLAMGVLAVVGVFLVSLIINNNNFSFKQNAIINEGLSLNDSVREIDKMIRQAVTVSESYNDGSNSYTTGANSLVLKIPALSDNGVINNVFDYVVITADSAYPNVIKMKVFPDLQSVRGAGDTVLTTGLKTIEFNYLDKTGNIVTPTSAYSVKFTLTVFSKSGLLQSRRSATMITTLRNNSQ